MIPRIFHRIWLGPDPMPARFVHFGETWMKYHPDWTMQLWTDESLPALINEQEFLQAETFAQKSDILRYELLLKFGGVYLDTDVECLKCINPLLVDVECFASKYPKEYFVMQDVVGAAPEHPFLVDVVRQLPQYFHENSCRSIVYQTGPLFFTTVIKHHPEVKVFEQHYFHAEPYLDSYENYPDTYAVHHWARSWAGDEKKKIEPLRRKLLDQLRQQRFGPVKEGRVENT